MVVIKIKKINGIMDSSKYRSKKFDGVCKKGTCEKCGAKILPCKTYSWVDGNSAVITSNAPNLCKTCYESTYHEHISTDMEVFQRKVIRYFRNWQLSTKEEQEKEFIQTAIKIVMSIN